MDSPVSLCGPADLPSTCAAATSADGAARPRQIVSQKEREKEKEQKKAVNCVILHARGHGADSIRPQLNNAAAGTADATRAAFRVVSWFRYFSCVSRL